MRKCIFIILLVIATCLLYAEGDYRGGNGTLLHKETIGDKEIEIRKFEISDYWAGLAFVDDNTIYDDYIKKNKIGSINCAEEGYVVIDIYEVCFIKYLGKAQWGYLMGETWIKLSDKKITGWLCIQEGSYDNYYEDGYYSYIGNINGYNIRKLNQGVSACVNPLEIREMPGYATKIVAKVKTEYIDEYGVVQIRTFEVVASTDGEEWVKIEYENGKLGWVHGDCLSAERGGPVFLTPENEILWIIGEGP